MEARRQILKPSHFRFLKQMIGSNEAINEKVYSQKLKEYIRKRKINPEEFLNFGEILQTLINIEKRKFLLNAPQVGFELGGGVFLTLATGKMFLLPANYTIYPIRAVIDFLSGNMGEKKRIKPEVEMSLREIFKTYTAKYSPTGEAVKRLAKLYELLSYAALHEKFIENEKHYFAIKRVLR